MRALAWAGMVALVAAAGPAAADTYPTFDKVPYVYAQVPARFSSLFLQADTGTVRLGVLGDSQETSPGGGGNAYIARLGYEYWRRYGNVPETQLSMNAGYGDDPGSAEFLLGGQTINAFGSRIAASRLPPGLGPQGFRDRTTDNYPALAVLRYDGSNSSAALPSNPYFKTGASIDAQIFAATNAASGEIHWDATPSATPNTTYFAPVTASGTTGMGLTDPTFKVKTQTVNLPTATDKPYMEMILSGTDPSVPTDLIGVRFRSTVDTHGVAVQDLAAGGYLTRTYLDAHPDSGEMLRALGFSAVVLHYGTNDAGNGLTADQFKAAQVALIAAIRGWEGDLAFPVILAGDPYASNMSAAQLAQFDEYAGAQKSIADADPNVLVLNSRRLTDDLGWRAGGHPGDFLADGVHYTPEGAAALAQAEVTTLVGMLVSIPEPVGLALWAPVAFLLCRRRRGG